MLSPAASYTTVVFFMNPGGIVDLASLSFHVPRFGSWAKHTPTPTKHSARVSIRIVLAFMSFSCLLNFRSRFFSSAKLYTLSRLTVHLSFWATPWLRKKPICLNASPETADHRPETSRREVIGSGSRKWAPIFATLLSLWLRWDILYLESSLFKG